MTEHSPIPWELDKRIGCLAIYPADTPKDVSRCLDGASAWAIHFKQGKWGKKEREWGLSELDCANAEFIVRCVNAHDALVEALRSILSYSESVHLIDSIAKIHAIADKALVLAEGEERGVSNARD